MNECRKSVSQWYKSDLELEEALWNPLLTIIDLLHIDKTLMPLVTYT